MVSGSTLKKVAMGRLSYLSMNLRVTIEAGSRRCVSLHADIAVSYAARGYPPSETPADESAYSQDRARDDIRSVLDSLGIEKAHIVGLSMGGFATLHFGLNYPDRALSLVVAGCGYGAEKNASDRFKNEVGTIANTLLSDGMVSLPRNMRWVLPECSFKTKTHAVGENLPSSLPSTMRPVRLTRGRSTEFQCLICRNRWRR